MAQGTRAKYGLFGLFGLDTFSGSSKSCGHAYGKATLELKLKHLSACLSLDIERVRLSTGQSVHPQRTDCLINSAILISTPRTVYTDFNNLQPPPRPTKLVWVHRHPSLPASMRLFITLVYLSFLFQVAAARGARSLTEWLIVSSVL